MSTASSTKNNRFGTSGTVDWNDFLFCAFEMDTTAAAHTKNILIRSNPRLTIFYSHIHVSLSNAIAQSTESNSNPKIDKKYSFRSRDDD